MQRQFVLAIWGRETAFGAHKSSYYVVKALATQAYLGRRKDMFRTELLYALKMLQDGVRTRETMTGSWAGAMGLTQFMPSEYYTVAYDLDGDGRKDIWGSVPDALGSAANQLRAKGWVPNQTWGYEVRLPKDISCLQEGPDNAKPLGEWVKLGVVRAGGDFPAAALDQQAFVLTPAGAYGPAFLALENFLVIKRYNMSDLYALFVGNLGDRIAGGGAFVDALGRRPAALRQGHRGHPGEPAGARLRRRQDRRQGRHEHALADRRLSEGQRPEGRLLAHRGAARPRARQGAGEGPAGQGRGCCPGEMIEEGTGWPVSTAAVAPRRRWGRPGPAAGSTAQRSAPGRMKLCRSSCTVIGLPFHMPIGISSRTTLL